MCCQGKCAGGRCGGARRAGPRRGIVEAMGGHDLDTLLDRFTAELRRMLPLVAVWAHGSLALGDFQPGHSDLDLIAVVESQVTGDQRRQLTRLHESLAAEFPAAV